MYELVLWVEPNLWSFNDGGGELSPSPTSVTVSLSTLYDVKVYDPLIAASPQSTSSKGSSVSVSLVDHPIIVELTPAQ